MEVIGMKVNGSWRDVADAARANKHLGKRFGRLTVIGTAEPYIRRNGSSETVSIVRCDCGKIMHVRNCSLTSGLTRSCGCLKMELTAARNKKRSVTGMSHSRIYSIFMGMHARCENPKHVAYKNYGEKGIAVCYEWRAFKAFYEWAIANGYDDILTIDRIDSYLGYCPSNCRFVTMAEQERNKPSVTKFAFGGRELTIPQIADEIGISKQSLYTRIKHGVPESIAFSAIPDKGNNFKKGVYKCA